MSNYSADDIVLVGMPFDAYSSYLRGVAAAPSAIREMIACDSANSSTELGLELGGHVKIIDSGDLRWSRTAEAFDELEKRIEQITGAGAKPLTFGGDHSITFPVLRAMARHRPDITILHFDAHPDLYHELDGNPLSHASPFARIMENKLASRLIQVGIRTLNQHQADQAERFQVEIHPMKDWRGPEQLNLSGPLYVSIDIDALDPAYAPGVSHLEPGGLSVRQIIDVLHSIDVPVIGADIVEYNPSRDINGMTAMVATKLYKEVCGKMLRN